MLVAIHKCDFEAPECSARGLVAYGADEAELRKSLEQHWDIINTDDPSTVALEIYELKETRYFSRTVTINQIQVN